MRISVLANDPGFSPRAGDAVVTLSGTTLREWLTADDGAGFVRVSETEVRRGKVEIVLTPKPAPKAKAKP